MSIREAANDFDVTTRALKIWIRDHQERAQGAPPELKEAASSSVSPPVQASGILLNLKSEALFHV
jgi:transposase-like protein